MEGGLFLKKTSSNQVLMAGSYSALIIRELMTAEDTPTMATTPTAVTGIPPYPTRQKLSEAL